MTHADYRRERVKHYEAMLDQWRQAAGNDAELWLDIRDLETHVNQLRSVVIDSGSKKGGRPMRRAV
jgi:hypothetical protein